MQLKFNKKALNVAQKIQNPTSLVQREYTKLHEYFNACIIFHRTDEDVRKACCDVDLKFFKRKLKY